MKQRGNAMVQTSGARSKLSDASGFTIVELLIVIVVIGILAVITVVSFGGISGRAQDAGTMMELKSIEKQTKVYRDGSGGLLPGYDKMIERAGTNNRYVVYSHGDISSDSTPGYDSSMISVDTFKLNYEIKLSNRVAYIVAGAPAAFQQYRMATFAVGSFVNASAIPEENQVPHLDSDVRKVSGWYRLDSIWDSMSIRGGTVTCNDGSTPTISASTWRDLYPPNVSRWHMIRIPLFDKGKMTLGASSWFIGRADFQCSYGNGQLYQVIYNGGVWTDTRYGTPAIFPLEASATTYGAP